jgi:hypothetical protein
LRAEAGAGFIITRLFALPHTASWWQSEVVFSPQYAPASYGYAPRSFRWTSNLAARRIRAERHNPASIATLRIKIARFLLTQLPHCPFCCALRL